MVVTSCDINATIFLRVQINLKHILAGQNILFDFIGPTCKLYWPKSPIRCLPEHSRFPTHIKKLSKNVSNVSLTHTFTNSSTVLCHPCYLFLLSLPPIIPVKEKSFQHKSYLPITSLLSYSLTCPPQKRTRIPM